MAKAVYSHEQHQIRQLSTDPPWNNTLARVFCVFPTKPRGMPSGCYRSLPASPAGTQCGHCHDSGCGSRRERNTEESASGLTRSIAAGPCCVAHTCASRSRVARPCHAGARACGLARGVRHDSSIGSNNEQSYGEQGQHLDRARCDVNVTHADSF